MSKSKLFVKLLFSHLTNRQSIYSKGVFSLVCIQSKQKTNINIVGKKLDEWVKIIKDTLEKSLTGVGKGSFNLNVASKEIYEYLKLKKYMTVVKCLMQDVLHNLVTKSMENYVKFFQKFIPMKTEVKDVNQVVNTYEPEEIIEEIDVSNKDCCSS